MSLLLKNAVILDSNSPVHNQLCNLLIENGIIKSLNGKTAKKEYDLEGKMVSIGWFDLNANFNDPGNEHKEDIESGSSVALHGGFTDINLIPDTYPAIETKSDVEYLIGKSGQEIDVHVSAALSEQLKGDNLTEIFDLNAAGARSFSDGDNPIWNPELLLKALQYTKSLNAPVIQNAKDKHLAGKAQMHEGKVSINLGLRGEPSLSEELVIMRDLEILKYSGGKIHFTKISTAKSVELIKKAKEEELNVTSDVSIHHLLFTDESIRDFDTTFKNSPSYRTEFDKKALIKGVKEGVIDAICSNHRPQDQESKQLEFDLSEPGSISLQTFYPALNILSNKIPMEVLLERITNGSRRILGLEELVIKEGMEAKLTILNPTITWVLDAKSNRSKSKNSPFWGQELSGKVHGTINRDIYTFF